MPMVAPSRSPTATWPRSDQRPSRTRSVRGPNRLTRCRARARTPSATARVPLPGVTTTVTPRAPAASRSTRSTPTPVRATTRSRGARSRKAASTTASARAMAPAATARSSAPGSGTNDTPSPRTPATRAGSTWPRATTTDRSAAIAGQLQLRRGGGEGGGRRLADGELPERLGEDLDPPGPGPAGGAERPDAALKVEGTLPAQAPTVGGVLEQGAHLVGVGVVELHADDVTERDRGQLGRRRPGPFGVPHVDDESPGVVAGVLHQPQAVLDCPDVRPGKELQPDPGPGLTGVLGQPGELRHPPVVVPGFAADVGRDLDVACAERPGGLQELPANLIGPPPSWPVGPPVGEELQLQVDEVVVVEQRPDPGQAVLPFGHEQVDMEQPDPTEPCRGRGLDPFPQRERAPLVAPQRRRIPGGRPAGRQQVLVRHRFPPVAAGTCWPGPPGGAGSARTRLRRRARRRAAAAARRRWSRWSGCRG